MWCPKCKIEYREGITVCADCGAELVEEIENWVDVCEIKGKISADEIEEFLRYSGINEVKREWMEGSESFLLLVKRKDAQKAEKMVHGYLLGKEEEKTSGNRREPSEDGEAEIAEDFLSEEGSPEREEIAERETEDVPEEADIEDKPLFDEEVEEETMDLIYTNEGKEFVKRSEKYKDVKFSGYTLLVFGILGGVYLVLTQMKAIPLSYDVLIFCLLGVLFAGFFVAGIVSLVKAQKIKKEIPEEEERINEINQWMDENVTEVGLSEWRDESLSESENDLLVTAKLRRYVSDHFPEVDNAMIDRLVDDYYEDKFMD